MSGQDETPLPFTELNKDAQTSVVFIHGAFGSGDQWVDTARFFKDYHLLLPDLPGHGRSQTSHPSFSAPDAADLIAEIVRRRGKNGKARVVGLSLGAHVAVQLISRHPDIVDEAAFVTGYNLYPAFSPAVFAGACWLGGRLGPAAPQETTDGKGKVDEGSAAAPRPFKSYCEITNVICNENWPRPWPARTLIMVAGKRGPLPVTDRAKNARRLRDIGRKLNPKTIAYTHLEMRHDWPFEEPERFARAVLAWFAEEPLPEGFVEL